jgi:sortase (surface protein transpeptidase)
MTEEEKEAALDYFELLKEEEAENKKRQQQFSISLRKKKMETEKNTGPSREEIKIPKEENKILPLSEQTNKNLSEANEMKEREKDLIGEGITPKIQIREENEFLILNKSVLNN